MKCDERKPECLKCTETGRKCDGYAAGEIVKSKGRQVRNTRDASDVFGNTLSFNPPGNDQERRYLHYFHTHAASDLAGYFDSNFWNHLILQVSHSEPAVQHGLIALSSIHETLQAGALRGVGLDRVAPSQRFTLQQYNKALSHLGKNLSQKGKQSIEVTLISCILFICLELLRGNYESAVAHLQSGLNIMNDWREKNSQSTFSDASMSIPITRPIEDDLVQLFARLDLHASFLGTTMPRPYLSSRFETPNTFPSTLRSFSAISEARQCLDCQMNLIFQFLRATANYDPHFPQDSSTRAAEQHDRLVQLEQWLAAFNTFIGDSSSQMDCKDLQGAITLKIHHKTVYLMLSTVLSIEETLFDLFTPDFQTIVHLAGSLITPPPDATHIKYRPRFTLDMGIIGPLYYTAIKCRDPKLRREATSLIASSPHREGVWDNVVVSKLAERAIVIEEKGLPAVISAEDVPDSVRIRDIGLSVCPGERRGLVFYSKHRRYNAYEEWNTEEQPLTW